MIFGILLFSFSLFYFATYIILIPVPTSQIECSWYFSFYAYTSVLYKVYLVPYKKTRARKERFYISLEYQINMYLPPTAIFWNSLSTASRNISAKTLSRSFFESGFA